MRRCTWRWASPPSAPASWTPVPARTAAPWSSSPPGSGPRREALEEAAKHRSPKASLLVPRSPPRSAWCSACRRASPPPPSRTSTALLDGAPPVQISKLSSSLSHEIRNPLSSVKMAVQTLARNTGLSERDQRRLTIANREVRTMERMLWLLSEYGRDSVAQRWSSSRCARGPGGRRPWSRPELAERHIELKVDEEPGAAPGAGGRRPAAAGARAAAAQRRHGPARGLAASEVQLRQGPAGGR